MKKEKINERIYNHHRVINKNASYSMDLSDKTVSDRIHIKSDNAYDYIVNYMKFNHSAPFRPVIACVGVSTHTYMYMYSIHIHMHIYTLYICEYIYTYVYLHIYVNMYMLQRSALSSL